MGFDACLEDRKESYQCDCGGNITKDEESTCWTCDTCDFSKRTNESSKEQHGMIVIHLGNTVMQVFCECIKCNYGKIDHAYSWEHFSVLGWTVKRADIFNKMKASPYNSELKVRDNTFVEAYCPICGKKDAK